MGLRRIIKGMVNVDNYADGVASNYLTTILEKHEENMFINIRLIFEICENCPFVKFLALYWYCKTGKSKMVIIKHYGHVFLRKTLC